MGRERATQFLVVHSAGDGMTRWSTALAETISFAISNRLVMVEPCVRNGRIAPCVLEELEATDAFAGSPNATLADRVLGRRGMVRPLSAYRNATQQFRVLFPRLSPNFLMPYTEFIHKWNGSELLAQSHLLCGGYYSSSQCNATYQRLVWPHHIVGNSPEQRAPQALFKRLAGQPVMHVYYLRTGFFIRNPAIMSRIYVGLSTFAPAVVEVAHSLPAALGLAPGFYAYHWRSEKRCRDYGSCADRLLATKQAIEQKHGMGAPHRALLISDIPASADRPLWGGMSTGAHLKVKSLQDGASLALKKLLQANMTKLDTLSGINEADLGMLSIFDLLLGAQAGYLVTCATKHTKCAQTCAWVGGYANMLRSLRQGRNMSLEW